MFPTVDTKDPTAVASFVADTFKRMHPGASEGWLNTLFTDVEDLFTGRHSEYAGVDLRYHDLEHTLQTTVCFILLLEGRHREGVEPRLGPRHIELAVAAVLFHDTGYLKLRTDVEGTGAKYTYCHVRRSCTFAVAYLKTRGASEHEAALVASAIARTGPASEIAHWQCGDPISRVIGSALSTADYLAQMAAEDYPDELDALYGEFHEADEFVRRPVSDRLFKSAGDLMERTPAFWRNFVRKKLETDLDGVYRFLAQPYADGRNAYLEAVERNMAEISRRVRRPTMAGK